MCGIAGILSQSIDLREEKPLIKNISESLKMRGPDGSGEYVTRDTALIHSSIYTAMDFRHICAPTS